MNPSSHFIREQIQSTYFAQLLIASFKALYP